MANETCAHDLYVDGCLSCVEKALIFDAVIATAVKTGTTIGGLPREEIRQYNTMRDNIRKIRELAIDYAIKTPHAPTELQTRCIVLAEHCTSLLASLDSEIAR
jgi:hypothetical protein